MLAKAIARPQYPTKDSVPVQEVLDNRPESLVGTMLDVHVNRRLVYVPWVISTVPIGNAASPS